MALQPELHAGPTARSALKERFVLLCTCIICSVGGGIVGILLGLWLSDAPVTPDDGPSMISAGINGKLGGLIGLLLGPLAMVFIRTNQPRGFERFFIGFLTPIILVWTFCEYA